MQRIIDSRFLAIPLIKQFAALRAFLVTVRYTQGTMTRTDRRDHADRLTTANDMAAPRHKKRPSTWRAFVASWIVDEGPLVPAQREE